VHRVARVLQVHNHYAGGSPSGESVAVDAERQMLTEAGYSVSRYEVWNDSIVGASPLVQLKAAVGSVWSGYHYDKLSEVVRQIEPDVIHYHNVFPLLSPSVFAAGRASARVLTLHNYRFWCLNGLLMRDGKVCEDCLHLPILPGVVNRCYRGSVVTSAVAATAIGVNRLWRTFTEEVDVFIALSQFQRRKVVALGLPAGAVAVKSNAMPFKPAG
jgi:hypothetical protein